MIKAAIAFLILAVGSLSYEDLSHPHRESSMINNLRSFEFPDSSQHKKTCELNRENLQTD